MTTTGLPPSGADIAVISTPAPSSSSYIPSAHMPNGTQKEYEQPCAGAGLGASAHLGLLSPLRWMRQVSLCPKSPS